MEADADAAERARDRELAAVEVSEEDVALLMAELDMDKAKADRALRESGGDVMATLAHLMKQ